MQTEVIMQRQLYGKVIAQRSKSEYLSATDLINAGNILRALKGRPLFIIQKYLATEAAKGFIAELELQIGQPARVAARGRGHHTWVHPFLFMDIALAMDPKLKVEVYQWMHDHLLKYRNDSGDSYKRACGAIYLLSTNKSVVKDEIMGMAMRVRKACGVTDWQSATQEQLALRDNIHKAIELYSDVMSDTEQVIRLAILRYQSAESSSEVA